MVGNLKLIYPQTQLMLTILRGAMKRQNYLLAISPLKKKIGLYKIIFRFIFLLL